MPETHEMPGAIGRGFQMTRHEQKKQERATTTFACDVISIGPFTVSSIVGTVLTRAATSRPAKLRKLPRISRESCSATRACASWQLQLRCSSDTPSCLHLEARNVKLLVHTYFTTQ